MKNQPEMINVAGKRFWDFGGGEILPVVSGADGEPASDPGNTITIPNPADPAAPPANQPQPPANGKVWTEEDVLKLVEKTRKEEKDKLYPNEKALKDELARIKAEQKAAEDKAAKAQKEAEDKARKEREKDMDAKSILEEERTRWAKELEERDKRMAELEETSQRNLAILQKEQEFANLLVYTNQRVQEESDNIMPELRDLISGNTPEEIEQSIATMKGKTASVLQQVNQGRQTQLQQTPTAPVTSPPVGPAEGLPQDRTLTVEDLRNMPLTGGNNSYAQIRKQMGLDKSSRQGMFD